MHCWTVSGLEKGVPWLYKSSTSPKIKQVGCFHLFFFLFTSIGPSDPLKGGKVYFNLFSCPEVLILSLSVLQTGPSQAPLNPTFVSYLWHFSEYVWGTTITYARKELPVQKKTHTPQKLGIRHKNAMIQYHVPAVFCSGNQSLKAVS